MNALAMAPYAVIALTVMGIIFWIYRRGKAEGASQQSKKEKKTHERILKENAPDWYDGVIGTDRLFVRERDSWPERAGAEPGLRLVSDKRNGKERPSSGDRNEKRGDSADEVRDR